MKRERLKIIVRGAVQGVGFRPFVFRLAYELKLAGWILNSAEGVQMEIEGPRDSLDHFLLRLKTEQPPRAVIQSFDSSFLDPVGYDRFEIRESAGSGTKTALILPDIATCADCLREIFDPADRRFQYPFTNCTNCGPRFSIIDSLPYDRAHTSMKHFAMCVECDREYHDPLDRRFHAQPNACPRCGPQLAFWNGDGETLARSQEALICAVDAVRAGKILGLKGVGGFQLIVDATNSTAVMRLRERKHREEKPFAVMAFSIEAGRKVGRISPEEECLLTSPEAPIVLLERNAHAAVAEGIAPGNPNLGLMLPSSPLHHLLLHSLGNPVVATSGNLSDEPICIDENEALERLRGIADVFLVHDRPIVRHMDDSIVRIMAGREMILRRARGYAPLPISLSQEIPTILALGAHLKNSVALGVGKNIFVSQHLGDLETEQAYRAFKTSAQDLPRLYDATPHYVASDLHPEYLSTKYAAELPGQKISVQHHWAHIAAGMAENELDAPALGVAWDGTGYGSDGTIWGSEFLLATTAGSFERVAHLRQFRLPGGNRAIKEPRRSALGLLHEILGENVWAQREMLAAFSEDEASLLRQMLAKNIQSPLASSAGRLFDAVAALVGLRARVSFEGQAAMELEFIIDLSTRDAYPFALTGARPLVIDWEPAIRAMLDDLETAAPIGAIAAKFHRMLAEAIVAVAKEIGETRIVLSGGCFQNRYLLEHTIERLREENFLSYWPRRIPPNDGGISLGQIVAANWSQRARA